jgi:uncharacterized phage protein (TIGR01671 family)
MREILFRGKRIDNGEWVEGYYIKAVHHWHKRGIHEDWIITGASANGGWFAIHKRHAIDPETVGQYTGLTDKNGKKIFVGDIVVAEDYVYVCRWNECNIEFELANEVESFGMCYVYPDIEVIGNIHDNPELLKGGNT